MNDFISKFDKIPTPENALLDKEELEEIYENAKTTQEKTWARNRLITLRRTYVHSLREFIENAISYGIDDFGPWLDTTRELINLEYFGVHDELKYNSTRHDLINSLTQIIEKDLSKAELDDLIQKLEQTTAT